MGYDMVGDGVVTCGGCQAAEMVVEYCVTSYLVRILPSLKEKKKNMDQVNSWKWVLEKCELDEIDPFEFMSVMKVKNVGFVGDNLNENFAVS
ncbi:trichome birefringence-like protein 12 [Tanacetum coccineum]